LNIEEFSIDFQMLGVSLQETEDYSIF